jgi:branched-chain amino acid transport system permease protein
LALAAASFVIIRRIATSPFGRVLRGIRSDETLAQAMGKDSNRFKMMAFVVTSVIASCVGVTYAHYFRYVDPTMFDVQQSVLVMSMVIVGGAGSLYGPLVGALALVVLPEALRFFKVPNVIGPELKQIMLSAILLCILLYRPRGLAGRYRFGG